MNLKNLTDKILIKNTEALVKRERELLSEILWHLREIDRRRLFCDFGCSSLYQYAIKYLGYSEDQAYRRVNAARLLEALPEIEDKINTGELNLSLLSMAQSFFQAEAKARQASPGEEQKLSTKLSREQKIEVLKQLESTSTREAQKIVLTLSSAPQKIKYPEKQKPVTKELSELNFLADEALLEKINQLKGLLAHSHPHMSLAELVSYLCDLGLQKLAGPGTRKTYGNTAKRPATSKVDVAAVQQPIIVRRRRAYISIKTRREVWLKAQSKCERCGAKHALEIDHKMPVSCKGSSELENLRLLCRKCNQRQAIKLLSRKTMSPFVETRHCTRS